MITVRITIVSRHFCPKMSAFRYGLKPLDYIVVGVVFFRGHSVYKKHRNVTFTRNTVDDDHYRW